MFVMVKATCGCGWDWSVSEDTDGAGRTLMEDVAEVTARGHLGEFRDDVDPGHRVEISCTEVVAQLTAEDA